MSLYSGAMMWLCEGERMNVHSHCEEYVYVNISHYVIDIYV
jgi:hypothetical protein